MANDKASRFNLILNGYLEEITKIDVKSQDDARQVVNLLRTCQYALMNISFVDYSTKFDVKKR